MLSQHGLVPELAQRQRLFGPSTWLSYLYGAVRPEHVFGAQGAAQGVRFANWFVPEPRVRHHSRPVPALDALPRP